MVLEDGLESGSIMRKKPNYFLRLIDGDIPLVVTYWIWAVLIFGIGPAIVSSYIDQNYLEIAATPYGEQLVSIFDWTWLGIGIFMWVAIWNSAGKYEGKFWGGFARFMVIAAAVTIANEWIEFYAGAS